MGGCGVAGWNLLLACAPMDALLPSDPTSIDGYEIEGRLGSGGFGIVYAATSPDGVPVAIKVLRPELSDDVRLRERLAREAEALGRVEGERTAEIFKVVTEGDLVYLVMQRVEGESLTDQINDNGAFSGPMLWFAATGLVQALQEIHAAGIVHRDLKPSNVMYGPDGVKVLDFGISVLADETALTQTGAFVGTGAWMAPEMVLGNDVTEKTDVYALGLVLAFIALGRHPFGEGRADALMYRIANTDPDLDGMSEPFLSAVSMCLQRDPDDRPDLEQLAGFFGSNGEQQLSATSIVGSDAGGTRIVQPAPVPAPASGGGSKKRYAVIGSSIAAAAAAVVITLGVTGGGDERPPELSVGGDTDLQSDDVAFVQEDEEDAEQAPEQTSETPSQETEEVEDAEQAEPEPAEEESDQAEDSEAEDAEPATTTPTTTAASTPTAAPTTTLAPNSRCPGGGIVSAGNPYWWAQPSAPSADPGGAMLVQICGEDLAGLNSMSVELLDIDCQSGSQLTSGDLSALADPTYFFAEFTCIVPPDQAPGEYRVRGNWSGATSDWSLTGIAVVTGPPPAPTTTTTLPTLGATEYFSCTSRISGPWQSDGAPLWSGINAYVECETDFAEDEFTEPVEFAASPDVSDFSWNCTFTVNGTSHSCLAPWPWDYSGGVNAFQAYRQLDFTCGLECRPEQGDSVSWVLSVDSLGVGYPPGTIFIGQTSTSGSVTVP